MSILNPNQNHRILLDDAKKMTAKYRKSKNFNGQYGGFFGKAALIAMLEQNDCAGIRYYYGINDDENPVIVLVGATPDNIDLVDGELAEMAIPCPSVCDADSPLKND